MIQIFGPNILFLLKFFWDGRLIPIFKQVYINISYVTDKFLNHKERIDSLLFLYSLKIRSVNKAIPMLLEYNYYSGNKAEDEMTTKYFREVFRYKDVSKNL